MELDLLRSAPLDGNELAQRAAHRERAQQDARAGAGAGGTGSGDGEADTTWRLDRPGGPGRAARPRELISGGGRVLRPFTIMPSMAGMSERERLRSEVFRSGQRLPTMTVDEYLEEEQRRGNIITGGG
jgi:hypothetical protein